MGSDRDVVIRPARQDDDAAIARLCGELGYPSSAEATRLRLARIMASPDQHVLVAEVAGDVVGLAVLLRAWTINNDEISARLSTLVVDSSLRGRGLGAALVAASEIWAREQGAASLHLTSGSHRPEAHRFYAHLGYLGDGLRFRRKLT